MSTKKEARELTIGNIGLKQLLAILLAVAFFVLALIGRVGWLEAGPVILLSAFWLF